MSSHEMSRKIIWGGYGERFEKARRYNEILKLSLPSFWPASCTWNCIRKWEKGAFKIIAENSSWNYFSRWRNHFIKRWLKNPLHTVRATHNCTERKFIRTDFIQYHRDCQQTNSTSFSKCSYVSVSYIVYLYNIVYILYISYICLLVRERENLWVPG